MLKSHRLNSRDSLKKKDGFTFIELMLVLTIVGMGSVFVASRYGDKSAAQEGKHEAVNVLQFLESVKVFDPAEIYRPRLSDTGLSDEEENFINNALASGFNDLSEEFIDYQLTSHFGKEMLSAWGARYTVTTDVQEFSLQVTPPSRRSGCLAFISNLRTSPVHSIGFFDDTGSVIYKISDNQPDIIVKACNEKPITINYCNFLDGQDCENTPVLEG
ncbi:hypothetical protein VCHA53O466_40087 [Vibrio chagasii]|nr:hypothetical protein VCHA53O466_40087 [Vibrio chagasii]